MLERSCLSTSDVATALLSLKSDYTCLVVAKARDGIKGGLRKVCTFEAIAEKQKEEERTSGGKQRVRRLIEQYRFFQPIVLYE